MGEISEAAQKCCKFLKHSSSDTEKFAALFMVTKLVNANHANSNTKKAILEAIGFDFLGRLLNSTDVPDDCPPSMYKSVALSILTVFCNEEELATKKEILEFIPVFLEIVKSADDSENDDSLIIIGEAYNCLKDIATYQPGQKALVDANAIDILIEIYSQGSFQSDKALNIIVVLLTEQGASWVNKEQVYHTLLDKIAVDFETDQDKRKFEICEILHALVYNYPSRKRLAESAANEIWPKSVYKGLCDILQSRIGHVQRNPALVLTSTMLDMLGIDWILTDKEKGKQIFLLLIQLAAIEIRMQLDEKILKVPQQRLITACYVILELSINFIATDQINLNQKEKETVYTGLKGAFTAIVNLLLKVSKYKSKPSGEDKLFYCATIRVLVYWLAQETTAMRTEVYQLLPFMLELANETFYLDRARRIAETAGTPHDNNPLANAFSNINVLRVMLPAMCHLAVDDEARQIMLKSNEVQVLLDVLKFHWTIVHYERPYEQLKVLSQQTPELLEDINDSKMAIITTCNVLINLTVSEPKYVKKYAVFNNVLNFIFENLPELTDIPENLALHGNLAFLGLLLLKQLAKKLEKNDSSFCRFIQETIRFLWDAYIIDESNDPTALVVAISYKEHWTEIKELWFLGMDTLALIVSDIPWISEVVIESGWAEGMVQLLNKVKIGTLPPNIKFAFEDFLCHLVEANKSAIDVLRKAEALRMCKNHRMIDLSKKLFGD